MTSSAVGEFRPLLTEHGRYFGIMGRIVLNVISRAGTMTVETKAHIYHLRILGNLHFAHITVTGFAIQACGDMRTMDKMNKVWHLRHRHPGNLLVVQHVILQDCQFGTGIRDLHLLVTGPAF